MLDQYRTLLAGVRAGRPMLPDADLDTGNPPAPGVNALADETLAEFNEDCGYEKGAADGDPLAVQDIPELARQRGTA